jgi:hypothetical protein
MARQLYPFAKIGRPVTRVRSTWTVLRARRCKGANVGLIERVRLDAGAVQTSYAVVRDKRPILPNGTLLRAMDAVPFAGGPFCKCRDPEAWHSSLADAETKFRSLVRRGGR